MALLTSKDRRFLKAVSKINYVNPFLLERIQYEREALQKEFDESKANWNLLGDDPESHQVNTRKITTQAYSILVKLQARLKEGKKAAPDEVALYEDTALFLFFHYFAQPFKACILTPKKGQIYDFYEEFAQYWVRFFNIDGYPLPKPKEAPHVFACIFQVRRAFHYIFRAIIGRSPVAAELRAAVWDSIFTHDMRRYRRTFFKSMGDFATLIIGPTGSGKELVATAIGRARYIPFNPDTLTFDKDFAETFFPINLAALPTTLVESELFGHRRGAFTGAIENRQGWLAACPPEGSVFLDEIGELDPLVQVKLLRVMQSRTFQPLGSTKSLIFGGKIIAATHRDIHADMEAGRFRKDLYYRLCSDIITPPSLHQQVRESPELIRDLVAYIAQRVAGKEGERLAKEVMSWIEGKLGWDYPWPGNIRELEQCVRSIMIRREYHPINLHSGRQRNNLPSNSDEKPLSLDAMCRRYCTRIYREVGSYAKAARRLQVDRRTVKKYVD